MQATYGCVPARASRRGLESILVAVLLLSVAPLARGQTDNFNDGNDTGWARYAPLDPLAPPPFPDTDYSFPNGGYRINTPPSPSRATAGPGRAGSFRQDANYSQFYASVDLVNWNDAFDQAFGLLTRIVTPGLGTTNGYAFTYSTQGPSIDISRVTGEVATGLATVGIPALDPAQDYRLVFTGDGTVLTGSLYNLADLTTPVASIVGDDGTYTTGITGLVVFDNTGSTAPQVGADATFDNFVAGVVPEPGSAGILLVLGAWTLRRGRRVGRTG